MEQTIRLAIDGMHCANCVANVEKHYRALPSVIDVAVNLANNTGRVTFDPAQASVDDMLKICPLRQSSSLKMRLWSMRSDAQKRLLSASVTSRYSWCLPFLP